MQINYTYSKHSQEKNKKIYILKIKGEQAISCVACIKFFVSIQSLNSL